MGRQGSTVNRAVGRYHADALEEAVGGRRSGAPTASVREFSHACTAWARLYYVKNGKTTPYFAEIRQVLARLSLIYGDRPIDSLDLTCFKAVRQSWVLDGVARTGINHYAKTLRCAIAWGVSERLIPAAVLAEAQAVKALKLGRCGIRERSRVRPVADSVVDATLPLLCPVVADLLRLMRLTAMRPAEACAMRPKWLRTGGANKVWVYEFPDWKCAHQESLPAREILLGPRAQEIIKPRLAGVGRWDRPLFRIERSGKPITPFYLWRHVRKATKAAGLPDWFPYQLRHTRLTEVRDEFGIEVASAVAGHSKIAQTEHYAEVSRTLGLRPALASG